MKIVKQGENGQGRDVVWFATNKEEMDLLCGMAETTLEHLPKDPIFTITRGRLRNIIRTVRNYNKSNKS